MSSQFSELSELNEILRREQGGAFVCGMRGRQSLGWQLHILFQLNCSTTLNLLLIFNDTANGRGACRNRNATGPGGPLKGYTSLNYGNWQSLLSILQNVCSIVSAWKEMGIFATRTHLCLWPSKESRGEKKTWKISLRRKREKLGRVRGKEGRQRGGHMVRVSTFAHPCPLLAVVLRLIASPLGSINGWPHLCDGKHTSSWFWNIGKYALSSAASQKVAQCWGPPRWSARNPGTMLSGWELCEGED